MRFTELLERKFSSPKIFDKYPESKIPRILGWECECAVSNPGEEWGEDERTLGKEREERMKLRRLGFMNNGGRIYIDQCHLEICSPEVRTPFQALSAERAMETLATEGDYARETHKNNTDLFNGTSWGMHDNYWTKATLGKIFQMVPYFVTSVILFGSGGIRRNGEFVISPRAEFITKIDGDGTLVGNRGIICTRFEQNDSIKQYKRQHVIMHDCNMSQGAILLRRGITNLMFELAEQDKLPSALSEYDTGKSLNDLHYLAHSFGEFKLTGIKHNAIDVQQICLEEAVKHFAGRDECTDEILHLWDNSLFILRRDIYEGAGRFDYVKKKILLEAFRELHPNDASPEMLASLSNSYHDLNKETGLFWPLEEHGLVERYVSQRLIDELVQQPPTNTRAYLRGNIVRKCVNTLGMNGFYSDEWNRITLPDELIKRSHGMLPKEIDMGDPFNSHQELVERIKSL